MTLIHLTMIRGTIVDEDEQEVEATTAVHVNPEHIRSFNARKNDKPGTRITFVNGTGFAVTESPEQVLELINA